MQYRGVRDTVAGTTLDLTDYCPSSYIHKTGCGIDETEDMPL